MLFGDHVSIVRTKSKLLNNRQQYQSTLSSYYYVVTTTTSTITLLISVQPQGVQQQMPTLYIPN